MSVLSLLKAANPEAYKRVEKNLFSKSRSHRARKTKARRGGSRGRNSKASRAMAYAHSHKVSLKEAWRHFK